jgi:hypothetical protein
MQSTWRMNLGFRPPQIIACIAIAIAEACSSAESGNRGALPMSSFTADRSASQAESAQASQAGGKGGVLDGVWKGTTTAYCSELRFQGRCNAQQKVTMTFVEQGAKITGDYECAYGNHDCHPGAESGRIVVGSLNGSQVKVQVAMSDPEQLICIYNGHLANSGIGGGYECLSGGALMEQGTWQMERVASDRGYGQRNG